MFHEIHLVYILGLWNILKPYVSMTLTKTMMSNFHGPAWFVHERGLLSQVCIKHSWITWWLMMTYSLPTTIIVKHIC